MSHILVLLYIFGMAWQSGFATSLDITSSIDPVVLSSLRDLDLKLTILADQLENLSGRFDDLSTRLSNVEEQNGEISIIDAGEMIDTNFEKIGQKLYYIESDEELDWKAAVDKCKGMNGHLISLENAEEWKLISGHLNVFKSYWVDISDTAFEGKEAAFFKWNFHELNNLRLFSSKEGCIELRPGYNRELIDCGNKNHFICEANNEEPIQENSFTLEVESPMGTILEELPEEKDKDAVAGYTSAPGEYDPADKVEITLGELSKETGAIDYSFTPGPYDDELDNILGELSTENKANSYPGWLKIFKRDTTDVALKKFQRVGEKMYYFENDEMLNWFEAKDKCKEMKADIAQFKNEGEWGTIAEFLSEGQSYWADKYFRLGFVKYIVPVIEEECIEVVSGGDRTRRVVQCYEQNYYICEAKI